MRRALLAALVAALSLWPTAPPARGQYTLGLYRHTVGAELASADFRATLLRTFGLIIVHGSSDLPNTPGVAQLTQAKGAVKVILYRRGTAVADADVAALTREHPDWLTHDSNEQLVRSNAGGTVIDVTNPAVRRWLVDGLVAEVRASGYDGVYLDVLGSFFSSRFYSGRPVVGGVPVTDASWRDGCISLVKEVKAATGKTVIANGFGLQSGSNYEQHRADSDLLIDAADGIQIEQFTRTVATPLTAVQDPAAWRSDVDFLRQVSGRGKLVLVNTRVESLAASPELDRVRDFALASFLVGAEGQSSFQFGESQLNGPTSGRAPVDIAAQLRSTLISLGSPRGESRQNGGVVVRDFEGGEVAVNPNRSQVTVDLQGQRTVLGPDTAKIAVGQSTAPTSGSTQPPATRGHTGSSSSAWWLVLVGVLAAAAVVTVLLLRARRGQPVE